MKNFIKFLTNQKVKSLSIEINENFKEQYETVLDLMEKNKFKILHKRHNDDLLEKSKFNKVYNFVFVRNE